MALRIEPHQQGVVVRIKVVPGASRERIVGVLGDALKVAVNRPPEGGAANAAVVELLAEQLQIPARNVRIIRGQGNPRKTLLLVGLTAEQALAKLQAKGRPRS